MNKKFKNLFLAGALILGFAGVAVSCTDYDSDIDALQNQINAVKTDVANLPVASLQTQVQNLQNAIDNGAVITAVTPFTTGNGGYVFTLSDNTSYTISNGANGTNGTDGKTPEIGSNGNWWIGGQDTGKKAIGQDGAAGETPFIGTNGNWWIGSTDTGVQAQGEDGNTPYIKDGNWWIGETDTNVKAEAVDGKTPYIGENGNWWIGDTDTEVYAKAPVVTIGANGNWFVDGTDTGKPSRGEKGDDGDNAPIVWYTPDGANNVWVKHTIAADAANYPNGPVVDEVTNQPVIPNLDKLLTAVISDEAVTISNVQGAEGGKVVINLKTPLRSLAIVPEVIYDGLAVIEPYVLEGKEHFGSVSDEKTVAFAADVEASYRVNPVNANIAAAEYAFVNRVVELRAAAADKADFVTIKKTAFNTETNFLDVTMNFNAEYFLENAAPTNDWGWKADVIALQATLNQGVNNAEEVITSDYAIVDPKVIYFGQACIIDKEDYEATPSQVNVFPTTVAAAKAVTPDPETYKFQFIYDQSFDLKPFLETYAAVIAKTLPEVGFAPIDYAVSVDANEYLVDQTNQQKFIKVTDGVVAVDDAWLTNMNPAVDKTPIVKVVASYKGAYLCEAYIKFLITDYPVVKYPQFVYGIDTESAHDYVNPDANLTVSVNYKDLGTKTINLGWSDINEYILDSLKLSYNNFKEFYYTDAPHTTTVDGVTSDVPGVTWAVWNATKKLYEPADGTTGFSFENTINTPDASTNALSVTVNNLAAEKSFIIRVIIPTKDDTVTPDIVVVFNFTIGEYDFTKDLLQFSENYLLEETVDGHEVVICKTFNGQVAEHFVDYLIGYKTSASIKEWQIEAVKKADGTPKTPGFSMATTAVTDPTTAIETIPAWTYNLGYGADLSKAPIYAAAQVVFTLQNGRTYTQPYYIKFVSPIAAGQLAAFVAANEVAVVLQDAIRPDSATLDFADFGTENGYYTVIPGNWFTPARTVWFNDDIVVDENGGSIIPFTSRERYTRFVGQGVTAETYIKITNLDEILEDLQLGGNLTVEEGTSYMGVAPGDTGIKSYTFNWNNDDNRLQKDLTYTLKCEAYVTNLYKETFEIPLVIKKFAE